MANCSNCNASLPDGSLICQYCGSRNDIDLRGIHYYTTHESETPRICPRCAVPLATIDLNLQGKFLIDRCNQCLGLFFDPGELDALLDALVANVYEINGPGLDAINLHREPDSYPVSYIKCPVCSQLMNRVNFGARSGVIIDRCKAHGVWLDGGELNHLLEWMKMGGKLLDQERREERLKDEQKRQEEQHRQRSSEYNGSASFHEFSEPLRRSDPDLLDLIVSAIRFFIE